MRRAARLVAVLGAVGIAACFSKPGEPHANDTADPDARRDSPSSIDAAIDAFVSLPCVHDEFDIDTVMDCQTWGNLTTTGTSGMVTVNRPSGQLEMDFGSGGLSATCTTKQAIDITKGTSIYLAFPPPAGGITYSITNAGKTTIFTAHRAAAQINFLLDCDGPDTNINSPSTDPPQWMQFEATHNQASVVVTLELSADGIMWTPYGSSCTYNVAYSPTATVSIGADSGSGGGSAYWDFFNTKNCP